MNGYVQEIKRRLRDDYGFEPSERSTDAELVFDDGVVPDGEYPMEIEGRLDRVRVVDGTFDCCNFDEEEESVAK